MGAEEVCGNLLANYQNYMKSPNTVPIPVETLETLNLAYQELSDLLTTIDPMVGINPST